MDFAALTQWGSASLVVAWPLMDQEMDERKLDVVTLPARRVVCHAVNTEAVLGLTEEQCKDNRSFNEYLSSQPGFMSGARLRMWAQAQELLTHAPCPLPPNFIRSAPRLEDTWDHGDGTMSCVHAILTFGQRRCERDGGKMGHIPYRRA